MKLQITKTSFLLLLIPFFLTTHLSADKLCIKKRTKVAANNYVKNTKLLKVKGECPSRFLEVLDTASFKGETGQEGESAFTATQIPPGELVKGSWGGLVYASDSSDGFGFRVSFPLPASIVPSLEFVSLSESNENCPGTILAPDSAPGVLCLYESFVLNASINDAISLSGDAAVADIFGSFLYYSADGPGNAAASGTWSYREPTS